MNQPINKSPTSMKILPVISIILFLPYLVAAQQHSDEEILETLLHEFLQGASENDVNAHLRFWSDDLIYTSAAAERIRKEDIIRSYENGSDQTDSPLPQYFGDEIEIQLYGNAAVVAFRLNAEIHLDTGNVELLQFYNTGTFVKEDGEWRAVAWHVTEITN